MNLKSGTHSQDCLAASIWHELIRIGYTLEWPDYCRNCNGNGAHCYLYDPSPAGVSLSAGYMTDCDPCAVCSENGRCPRCAAETLNDDNEYSHCRVCGWDDEISDGLDLPFECICYDYGEPDYDQPLSVGDSEELIREVLDNILGFE